MFLHLLVMLLPTIRSVNGVATGMTHYEHPNTTAQLKDAIMNHGAISVAIKAQGTFMNFKPSSSFLPAFPLNLDVGVSCTREESTGKLSDHAVTLVGWAPCKVTAEHHSVTVFLLDTSW
jgi:hypothetical protein